jgi:hypothetical protein
VVFIARREALAHRLKVDVLIVRSGDREHPLNTEADRASRDLLHSVCDPKGTNRKRARRLRQGHPEVITDQSDDNMQAAVLIALLLEGALHLGELRL